MYLQSTVTLKLFSEQLATHMTQIISIAMSLQIVQIASEYGVSSR